MSEKQLMLRALEEFAAARAVPATYVEEKYQHAPLSVAEWRRRVLVTESERETALEMARKLRVELYADAALHLAPVVPADAPPGLETLPGLARLIQKHPRIYLTL